MIRRRQSGILINNRLDGVEPDAAAAVGPEATGASAVLGDFGTPEHVVVADPDRPWESCQVTTQRLWGYTPGERWKPAHRWLDALCDAASQGGNLLLNVGPDPQGRFPAEFLQRNAEVGRWLAVHGQAIYGARRGDLIDTVTLGYLTRRGNTLFLILRFDDKADHVRLSGLRQTPTSALWVADGSKLTITSQPEQDAFVVGGLPDRSMMRGADYPVIQLIFSEPPSAAAWAGDRLWQGPAQRMLPWTGPRQLDDFGVNANTAS